MIKEYKIAVIGAGAAGMMAAVAAGVAFPNGEVVLFEAKDRPGRKISASGNGRCNFSHRPIDPRYYHGDKLVREVYANHSPQDTLNNFEKWGLLHIEEEGRLYPYSGTASSILDILTLEMNRLKIQTLYSTPIVKIRKHKKGFSLMTQEGIQYRATKVILTTGGKAAPQLGYEGGYALAEDLGHPCTPLIPGLVGLTCSNNVRKKKGLHNLDGLRVRADVAWKPLEDIRNAGLEPLIVRDKGEVLFRSYGLSGIVIFQMSRFSGEGILSLDLFGNMNKSELMDLLRERKERFGHRSLADFFVGMFHSKIAKALLKESRFEGADLERKVSALGTAEIERMADILKAWTFPVEGTTGWGQAQVTLGGLERNAFFPTDLQSRLHPGLYAAGEILDVDGPCGGFNLQWAWSSGWVAGSEAAQALLGKTVEHRRSND